MRTAHEMPLRDQGEYTKQKKLRYDVQHKYSCFENKVKEKEGIEKRSQNTHNFQSGSAAKARFHHTPLKCLLSTIGVTIFSQDIVALA